MKTTLCAAAAASVTLLASGATFAVAATAPEYTLPSASQDRYEALQSIAYEFGSKFTTGYFEARGETCLLTLMLIEKSPADNPLPFTAARIRLTLNPGQIAGLDSEEGRSLNFTCGPGATAVLVDVGERDKLVTAATKLHAGGE